jgi:hypothetical protein
MIDHTYTKRNSYNKINHSLFSYRNPETKEIEELFEDLELYVFHRSIKKENKEFFSKGY